MRVRYNETIKWNAETTNDTTKWNVILDVHKILIKQSNEM